VKFTFWLLTHSILNLLNACLDFEQYLWKNGGEREGYSQDISQIRKGSDDACRQAEQ